MGVARRSRLSDRRKRRQRVRGHVANPAVGACGRRQSDGERLGSGIGSRPPRTEKGGAAQRRGIRLRSAFQTPVGKRRADSAADLLSAAFLHPAVGRHPGAVRLFAAALHRARLLGRGCGRGALFPGPCDRVAHGQAAA